MAISSRDKVRQLEPGVWKLKDGRYYVEIRPEGKSGAKVKRTFDKATDAKDFKVKSFAKAQMGESFKPLPKDGRKLSALINLWYDLYGYTLKDGEKRLGKLLYTCKLLGDPPADRFTAEDWLLYRKERLQTVQRGKNGKKITPNTVNHEHAYLSAVYGRLIQLNKWNLPNPLQGVPRLGMDEPELIFLEKDQIRALLKALAHSNRPDVLAITKLCLSTGARWGEAEGLERKQVKVGKVHFYATKNGKSRSIPISPELQEEILEGRPRSGRLFVPNCVDAFETGIHQAGIKLPDGQLTHVLRHTFASHFMMNDGNILKLKDILGHKTLAMTLRYAKLAPSHLTDALTLNPLATLDIESIH